MEGKRYVRRNARGERTTYPSPSLKWKERCAVTNAIDQRASCSLFRNTAIPPRPCCATPRRWNSALSLQSSRS